jgi:hypothetical protein
MNLFESASILCMLFLLFPCLIQLLLMLFLVRIQANLLVKSPAITRKLLHSSNESNSTILLKFARSQVLQKLLVPQGPALAQHFGGNLDPTEKTNPVHHNLHYSEIIPYSP